MNTVENNKLITSFMGGKLTERIVVFSPENEDSGETIFAISKLKYHESWDWLMPVVEKIESLGFDSRIIGNNSDGGFLCDFVDCENKEASSRISYQSKIEATYFAVVDFIKWYNEHEATRQII